MAFGILFHGRVLAAKTIFVVSTRLHIAALTTRFRELDGEAKSIIKSLLAVVVKVAGMPAGLTDDVDPFATDLICAVTVVPPNTQLSLGISCSHGSCPWID